MGSQLLAQDNVDFSLLIGLETVITVVIYLGDENVGPEREDAKKTSMMQQLCKLLALAASGSTTAQHVLGMLMYYTQCDSGTKADFLDAARWIRKAALQGVREAQYELGEMFRHGLFCDHIYMRFARKYIRRASVQGHVEAIARMKELRSCVMCGMDDAPLACSRCHQARYCDSACSKRHWCKGDSVGSGVSGGAGARHKDTCPRTHSRGR